MAIFFLFMQALDNFAHFESLKRMGAQRKTENVSFFFGLFPYGPPPKPMLSMGHFKLKKRFTQLSYQSPLWGGRVSIFQKCSSEFSYKVDKFPIDQFLRQSHLCCMLFLLQK